MRSFDKVTIRYPKLMGKAGLVVRDLYNLDLVEEEVILKWATGGGLKEGELRKRISAFIEWLQTAEEEEEGDE